MQNYKSANSSFSIPHPSFACRHNLQYWRGLPYLAFGAGAHGYAAGYRYSNVLRIKTYIERLLDHQITKSQIAKYPFPLSPATVNHHKQSIEDDLSEFMMTGLRLTREGVSEEVFQKRFGRSMRDVYGSEIEELLGFGLIEQVNNTPLPPEEGLGTRIRLTKHGRLLGNQVFMRFV
jgi:oxygen-independent coproporphyrinogen-3 oxidase